MYDVCNSGIARETEKRGHSNNITCDWMPAKNNLLLLAYQDQPLLHVYH